MIIYSAGLRISESISLCLQDLEKDRMVIRIRQAKGKKDRYVPLSEKLVQVLNHSIKKYNPKKYFFEGQIKDKGSTNSIQKIFHRACQKAEIEKNATVHTLKHSFAAHLLEHGLASPGPKRCVPVYRQSTATSQKYRRGKVVKRL